MNATSKLRPFVNLRRSSYDVKVKFEFDTLQCVRMLIQNGISLELAEPMVAMLASSEFWNLYSKREVDSMLNETVEKVFRENRAEVDRRLEEQRRGFDKWIEEYKRLYEESKRQYEEDRRRSDAHIEADKQRFETEMAKFQIEAKADRRWVVGTIITVGVALAGYLSALIHFTH